MKKIDISTNKYPNTFALVDDEDFERVNQLGWYVNKGGYVIHNQHYTKDHKRVYFSIRLSRFIMSAPKGMIVDHINHDLLDNRKENLRICTQSENLMNAKLRKDNSSGVRGIYWIKDKKKYRVEIQKRNKVLFRKYFKTLEEAIQARKKAEKTFFGEYAFIKNA